MFNCDFYVINFLLAFLDLRFNVEDLLEEVASDIFFIDILLVEIEVLDLFESGPFVWVEAEHLQAEVFEVL